MVGVIGASSGDGAVPPREREQPRPGDVRQYGSRTVARAGQDARRNPFDAWPVFFWLGLVIAPLMLVVWVINMVGLKEIRDGAGLPDSSMGIAALILALLLPPVGHILWAVHFNDTLSAAGVEV